MVVDASSSLTINKLASAHAYIDAIRQLDAASGIWYSLFPEAQQGQCTVGAVCWINMRLRNNGNGSGSCYLKITRGDTGIIIWNQSYSLGVNAYVDVDQISFVMPNANLALTFEIGHT